MYLYKVLGIRMVNEVLLKITVGNYKTPYCSFLKNLILKIKWEVGLLQFEVSTSVYPELTSGLYYASI